MKKVLSILSLLVFLFQLAAIPVFADAPVVTAVNVGIRGDKIILSADKPLMGTAAPADFTVTFADSGVIPVQTAEVYKDRIHLTLTTHAEYQEAVTVSYSGTGVKDADGVNLLTFTNAPGIWYTLAASAIPTDGLDLWLEADSGVTADAEGKVTEWTSKVNAVGAAAPRTLNTYSNTTTTPPLLRTLPSGRKAIHFNNKGFILSPIPEYVGELSVFMVTKKIGTSYGTGSIGYLFRTAEGTGSLQLYSGVENYTLQGSSGGVSISAVSTQEYTVLTGVSKDKDGDSTLKTVRRWQNNSQIGDPIHTSVGGTYRGFDTVKQYRVGHLCNDEIAAVLVYWRALNEGERESVMQYLYEKYVMDEQFTVPQPTYTYKDASGAASDGPVAGGKVTVAGSLTNLSVLTMSKAVLIGSAVQDGVLTSVKIRDFADNTVHKKQNFSLELDLPEPLDAAKLQIKLNLWDNFTNVRPLIKSIVQ